MSEGRGKVPEKAETAIWLDRLLGHWLLAAAMIMVAAALTIPQIDRNALGKDANSQLIRSHGLTGDPFTPLDVLEVLDVSQLPLSHLLLHYWGFAAGTSVAAARMLFLLAGLLSLAMVYRLARDAVAPIAGAFAVFVLLCIAFFGFFLAHVRFYPLMVLLAAFALWMYLRICAPNRRPRRIEFLALILAGAAMMITHASGYVLLAAMTLYHLAVVKKDRRWLQVVAASLVSLALISPLALRMFAEGLGITMRVHHKSAGALQESLPTWLAVYSNGSPLLFAFFAVCAYVGWRRGSLRRNPFLALLPVWCLTIGLSDEATSLFSRTQMRYLLVGAPIVAGFVASGLYALYRTRRWLGLLALLWMAAGLHFHATADWDTFARNQVASYERVPWHLVSRALRQTNEILPALAFNLDHTSLEMSTSQANAVLRWRWFEQYGLDMQNRSSLDIDGRIGDNRLERPGYWVIFQHGVTFPATIDTVIATMDKYGYEACGSQDIPNSAEILTYRWKSLQCDPQPKARFATDSGDYLHYGAVQDRMNLLFSGKWQPADDASAAAWNISFQLLDADWTSHAQIDLPASSLADMRQFAFDLTDFAAGEYRLVAIAYHAETGERLAWHDNADWVPEMRNLAAFAVAGGP